MKLTNRVIAAAVAVAFTLCAFCRAQSLTITVPGYTGYDLFAASPGYVVSGVATNGDRIWYTESDAAFPGSLSTRIWSRSFDGVSAGPATLVHDFGAPLNGSFLTLEGTRLYFGENSSGGIYAINSLTNAVDPLGMVTGNYDALSFGGGLIVSHYASPGNRLTRFALEPDGGTGLMLGNPDVILDTGTEFSGPVESVSSLMIYGSASSGLYRYFLTEVAAAIGPGQLSVEVSRRFLDNGANSYLARGDSSHVWRDSFSSDELQLIDTGSGEVSVIGTASGTLGNLDAAGDRLVAVVTQYGASTSSHVFAVIPEPTTAVVALGCLVLALLRRKS